MSKPDLTRNVTWINMRVATEQVAFGEVRYQPGGRCGPRVQRWHQLILLHSGTCQVTVDGVSRELTAGMVYLSRPGCREHWKFSDELETHHSWCTIKPVFFPKRMRKELLQAPWANPASTAWLQLLATAMGLCDHIRNPAGLWEIDLLGLALFAEYLNSADQSAESRHGEEVVSKAIHHMRNHLGEEDCLSGAQTAAGVSANVLIRRFQAVLQTTPGRFLWKLRTERGIAMLGQSDLTVAEIASLCGFQNPYHFSRCAKKLQGESPRAIRQKARQNPLHPF